MNSDKSIIAVVEEGDLVDHIHANWGSAESLSTLNVPDDHSVVVLASHCREELVVVREAKRLDQDLVEL